MKIFLFFTQLVLLLSSAGTAAPAIAQTWPDKPVRFVVPYAAGGTTDFAARQIAQKLTEQLGKSFFVENKAGASGTIGSDFVAKAAPDGATFLVNDTTYAMLPHLLKKLPWDHAADLVPVTNLAQTPLILVVAANSPYKTAQELIAAARAKPGQLNYGSGGVGSSTHLGAELFKSHAKVFITHIPYKGAGDAMLGVLASQVDLLVTAAPTAIPQVKGGRARALLVTSAQRLPSLPDVPTTAESGLPAFNATNWFGLAAPKGTPPAVIARLQQEVQKAFASPDLPSVSSIRVRRPVAWRSSHFRNLFATKHSAGVRSSKLRVCSRSSEWHNQNWQTFKSSRIQCVAHVELEF